MSRKMQSAGISALSSPEKKSQAQLWGLWGGWPLCVAVMFIYAGEMVPSVNDTHYLAKAKHFWDRDFAAGDIFLESSNPHWLFVLCTGWIAHFVSLPTMAWILRWVGWSCLSLGWIRLSASFVRSSFGAAVALGAWLAATHWGHMSGEWVVGSVEAKVFAYAASLFGLREIVDGRWHRSWPWFGLAAAFHVLVGGWLIIASLLLIVISFFQQSLLAASSSEIGQPKSNRMQLWWESAGPRGWVDILRIVVGILLSLVGIIPAMTTTTNATAKSIGYAARIYVYERLPHHLSFSHFSNERVFAFLILIAILALITLVVFRRGVWMRKIDATHVDINSKPQSSDAISAAQPYLWTAAQPTASCERLLCLVWITVALALVGIIIDLSIGTSQPIAAAKWLRFYWFRLADPMVPLGIVLVGLRVSAFWANQRDDRRWFGRAAWGAASIAGIMILCSQFSLHYQMRIAPADMSGLRIRKELVGQQQLIYRDWRAACAWIVENTPEDQLWITPRNQQSFKWYTGRPELANWKDIPQDVNSMLEWAARIKAITRRNQWGGLMGLPTETLRDLGGKYQVRWVLVDRRIDKEPPLLPLRYPDPIWENETYAIFELPPTLWNLPSTNRTQSQ